MKYVHVTRTTSCARKNTSCDKKSIIYVTEGFFPLKERIFLATDNFFPVTGIKEYLVSQYIFPVNESLFLATGKKISCHRKNKDHLVSHEEYFMAQETYFLWNRSYSCHRNSDIACDNKISSCQKNFSIDRQKNWLHCIWDYKSIEILIMYLIEFVRNSWEGG